MFCVAANVLPFNRQSNIMVMILSPLRALDVFVYATFNGVHPVSGSAVKVTSGLGKMVICCSRVSEQPLVVRVAMVVKRYVMETLLSLSGRFTTGALCEGVTIDVPVDGLIVQFQLRLLVSGILLVVLFGTNVNGPHA